MIALVFRRWFFERAVKPRVTPIVSQSGHSWEPRALSSRTARGGLFSDVYHSDPVASALCQQRYLTQRRSLSSVRLQMTSVLVLWFESCISRRAITILHELASVDSRQPSPSGGDPSEDADFRARDPQAAHCNPGAPYCLVWNMHAVDVVVTCRQASSPLFLVQ
jgi:hypothetical protein